MRTKICGVTTPEDAGMVADAGADAIGLNFHPASPRALSRETARQVAAALPPFVAAVGVFVDPDPALVNTVLKAVRLDALQFHGDEPAALCRSFDVPYIKATGVGDEFEFDAFAAHYPDAQALLLDAAAPLRRGGTGHTFNWSAWPRSERRLILAGGLTPYNVASAVAATRPYAVDVASGVEGDAKGRKDVQRVARFIRAAADA